MDGERVLGVIPVGRTKTGMFSSKVYTLVFTDRRLILAEMTSALVKVAAERARNETKAAGGGLLRQMGAQLKSSFGFGVQYLAMDPAAILAETAGNVALIPAEVHSIKVERHQKNSNEGDFSVNYLRVILETGAGKRTFETDEEIPPLAEARALAASLFGATAR
jgi:hypothetical protein